MITVLIVSLVLAGLCIALYIKNVRAEDARNQLFNPPIDPQYAGTKRNRTKDFNQR